MYHDRSQDWVSILPTVLLGLRSPFKEELGMSAAELVYGTPVSVTGDVESAAVPRKISKANEGVTPDTKCASSS